MLIARQMHSSGCCFRGTTFTFLTLTCYSWHIKWITKIRQIWISIISVASGGDKALRTEKWKLKCLYWPWWGWFRSCWIADFLASRKSARTWRGELSSRSMTEHKASATAWSKTVWHFSNDLLSCRIVDLIGRNMKRCSLRFGSHYSV